MTKNEEEKAIIFYCKDCEEIVDVNRFGKKYVYKCKKCGTKNVAFGTRSSIYGFFRLDEKQLNKPKDEEKVSEEKKVEEKKVEENKVEENKVEENKVEENKVEENKDTEKSSK